jgi:hypothetical protein
MSSPFPEADNGRSMWIALWLATLAAAGTTAYSAARVALFLPHPRAHALDAAIYAGAIALPFWGSLLVVAMKRTCPLTPRQRLLAWIGGGVGAIGLALPVLVATLN